MGSEWNRALLLQAPGPASCLLQGQMQIFANPLWFRVLWSWRRSFSANQRTLTDKILKFRIIFAVQPLSCVQFFATPWTVAHQAPLNSTISQSLLKFICIELVMPSNHLILCRPLLLLPSIFPSIKVFSNESALCIRWPKYWSFSFNISPSNEYSVLISFRMDWFDVLAVQGTLKSLLQHHKSKASTLWHSAFFMVQLSHSYMKSQDVCMHAKSLQSYPALCGPTDYT